MAVLALAFLVQPLTADNEKVQPMEGVWNCTSAIVDGKPLPEATVKLLRLTLTKTGYKTEKGSDVLFESNYTVDATKDPPHIDIIGTEGDLKGKPAQGIYTLAGDTLRLCYTMPGLERPKRFESTDGSGVYLLSWTRQK